jgi:hypothetical protein
VRSDVFITEGLVSDLERAAQSGPLLSPIRRLIHVVVAETTMSATSAADARKPTAAATVTVRCVLLTDLPP